MFWCCPRVWLCCFGIVILFCVNSYKIVATFSCISRTWLYNLYFMTDDLENCNKPTSLRNNWCRFCFYFTQPTSMLALAICLFTTYALIKKLIDDDVADCLYITCLPFWISEGTYKEKLKNMQNNFVLVMLIKKLIEELRK